MIRVQVPSNAQLFAIDKNISAKPQYGTTCRKAKQLETANSLAEHQH